MKIQFKHQPFQEEAARAVTDVFAGQRIVAGQSKYLMDMGADKANAAQMQFCGGNFDADGWKNAPVQPEIMAHLLSRINEVQKRNFIQNSGKLEGDGINLTVEMETGVGKTYTYIKTIHELYKKYGWMKFMVVVPSIAIREGVHKSFKDLEDHFMLEYHQKIHFFVYNSSRLGELDAFAKDSGIHVMIINSQAFAANFDKAKNVEGRSGDKAARIIFTRQDSMGGRRPIDVLSAMNPIIIIDEPQSVEGPAAVAAMKLFKPLFTLRYSATHKYLYNLVYRLDAVDALREKLVKKIAVKGISQTVTAGTESFVFLEQIRTHVGRNPEAVLRFDAAVAGGIKQKTAIAGYGYDLYQQSGNLNEYKNGWILRDVDAAAGYVEFQNGVRLSPGEVHGGVNDEMLRRIQIRETIKTHLQREEDLFKDGIKCLSLFFIDEVEKYKVYEDGNPKGGIYAQMFEEEYEAAREERLYGHLGLNPEYEAYLAKQVARDSHAGYFSIDKHNRMVNPTVERKKRGSVGEAQSNDVNAFDLIMKGKEKLLSFDDPEGGKVRFIFSHSALREGWDNPNVFQICTLKQATADIRKRQEVGRGLRLCVNKFGERQDVSVLGSAIHDVNVLTVIASESYEAFAKGLQDELAKAVGDRPVKVEVKLFENAPYLRKDGTEGRMSSGLAGQLNFCLIQKGYVDINGQLTQKYENDKAAGTLDLGEGGAALDVQIESVEKILERVFNPGSGMPTNALGGRKQQLNYEKFNSSEFKKLWEEINTKSAYTVKFDSDDLVKKAIEALDLNLHVPAVEFAVTTGELETEGVTKESLEGGKVMKTVERRHERATLTVSAHYRCDLIGEIVELTGLTRKNVAEILSGVRPATFVQFKLNPEAFIRRSAELINEQKANIIIKDITYNKVDGKFEENVFSEKMLTAYPDSKQVPDTKKGVYDLFVLDSDVEVGFCRDLEASAEVKVYTKLPRGFYIDTPVGKYNPDWAIVFEHASKKHVYFIAETKGTLAEFGLKKIEQAKIHCARKHFKAISSDDIKYEFINSYSELHNILMGLKG